MHHVATFLIHWAITALSLWIASRIFRGLKFTDGRSLAVAALVLGLANAIVRPVLVILTLPLTLLTFGLFLLVVNALVLLLVAKLVRGFTVSGFWTAVFAALFVSVLSLVIGAIVSTGDPGAEVQVPQGTVWL